MPQNNIPSSQISASSSHNGSSINDTHIQKLHLLILHHSSCNKIEQYLNKYKPDLSKDNVLLRSALQYEKFGLTTFMNTTYNQNREYFWKKRLKLVRLLKAYGSNPKIYGRQLIELAKILGRRHNQDCKLDNYKNLLLEINHSFQEVMPNTYSLSK